MCFAPQRRTLFDISTSKSGPTLKCFAHFDFQMCFAPQRRALFRHLNFQKWSDTEYILTWKCASRHNGVHFFNISTSKSGPRIVCFVHFHLEMCFAPQRRALFRHLNCQKWSENCVFCTCSLRNVLRATTACNLFISRLASWLRTRRFSEPTFRPSGATNHLKNTVFRDFPTFSRICIFFLLTLSLLLFFLLIFLSSNSFSSTLLSSNLSLLCSAFHLSILSEVWLLNFLRLYNTVRCVYMKTEKTTQRHTGSFFWPIDPACGPPSPPTYRRVTGSNSRRSRPQRSEPEKKLRVARIRGKLLRRWGSVVMGQVGPNVKMNVKM